MSSEPTTRDAWQTLRRFTRARPQPGERCELCGVELGPEHDHLVAPASRQVQCACQACALLFTDRPDGHFRRVPRRVERLTDFKMSDAAWDGLLIPINLAFFFRNSASGGVSALYPSPAGATESLLELDAWRELAAANPVLDALEPDVEALLVNRMGESRDYYRIGIDRCYELVGLVRKNWHGISGGDEVHSCIRNFFAGLKNV